MIKILLNVAVWLILLWAFTRFHLPLNSLFYNALQNSGHAIAFFILTSIAMVSLRPNLERIVPLSLLVALVLFLLGVTIEFVQNLSGRGASVNDLVMNGSGIVSGSIAYYVVRANIRWPVRVALAMLSISSIAWAMHKPAIYALAELTQKPLPTLYDFATLGAGAKLLPRHSEIDISDHSSHWPGNLSKSLKVSYGLGVWPSIIFQEPPLSWCDYDTFVFDVYSGLTEAVRLNIRIDDESIDYPDHSFMTVRRMIEPGAGQVIVHFDELAEDAIDRGVPAFNDMSSFQLFLPGNDRLRTLYFDNFRLMKSDRTVQLKCAS